MAVTELISSADAIAQLNLPSDYADTGELGTYIDASTAVVEKAKGAIVGRTVVQTFDGGGSQLLLAIRPVESVTSVVVDGVALDPSSYVVNGTTGLLTMLSTPTSTGVQNVVVTTQVGRSDAPPDWKLAALIVLQDLWATQRGAAGAIVAGGSGPGEDAALIRANYRLPRRAMELLGLSIPGIA